MTFYQRIKSLRKWVLDAPEDVAREVRIEFGSTYMHNNKDRLYYYAYDSGIQNGVVVPNDFEGDITTLICESNQERIANEIERLENKLEEIEKAGCD